jgi:hypothetical protein
MRSAVVIAGACSVCAALAACEDLGGLRGGEDAGAASDGGGSDGAGTDGTAPGDSGTPITEGGNGDSADGAACDPGPIANGLYAYFPFEEGGGAAIVDCGPSKLTAAVGGTKTWGAGKRGSALVFDGTSTCVSIAGDAPSTFTSPFTLSAWVNVTSFPTGVNALVIIGRTVDSSDDGFRLGADQGAVFDFKLGDPTDASVFRVTSPTQPTSTWRHVTAVFEPSTKSVLYVDGSAVDTDATNVPAMFIDAGAVLRIGCGASGAFFSGSIDEVRIYGRALGAVEIATLAAP